MRTLLIVSLLLALITTGNAETVRKIDWGELDQAEGLRGGQVIERDGLYLLKVENRQRKPLQTTVLVIETPGISAVSYNLIGDVEYHDVEGEGYLEMWSYFPDGSFYFSRTLAQSGPMRSLRGTSSLRQFILPFMLNGSTAQPSRLELRVVLPGRGTVLLGPLTLEQDTGSRRAAIVNPWWANRTGGLIGGVAGGFIGLLGAVIGVLASLGRARIFVFGAMYLLLVLGIAGLVTGSVAMLMKQPYAVYYPLLLLGVLATVLPLGLLPRMKQHYAQLELRRMQARDALN